MVLFGPIDGSEDDEGFEDGSVDGTWDGICDGASEGSSVSGDEVKFWLLGDVPDGTVLGLVDGTCEGMDDGAAMVKLSKESVERAIAEWISIALILGLSFTWRNSIVSSPSSTVVDTFLINADIGPTSAQMSSSSIALTPCKDTSKTR